MKGEENYKKGVKAKFHIKTEIPLEYQEQSELAVEIKKCESSTLNNFTLINPEKSESNKEKRALIRGCENSFELSTFMKHFLVLLAELSKNNEISAELECIFKKHESTGEFAKELLKLYTKESMFYKVINTISRMPPNRKIKECYKIVCSFFSCAIRQQSNSYNECIKIANEYKNNLNESVYKEHYEKEMSKESLLCFRTGQMEVKEAEQMKLNINKLYEVSSFLSTTLNIESIYPFTGNTLLIIEVPKDTEEIPKYENHGFVYLGNNSEHSTEEEVLFNYCNNFQVLKVIILEEKNFDGFNIIVKLKYGVLNKVQDNISDAFQGIEINEVNEELIKYYEDLEKTYKSIWDKNVEILEERIDTVQLTALNWEFFAKEELKEHQAKCLEDLIKENRLFELKEFLKWLIKREVYFQTNLMDCLNEKIDHKPKYIGDCVKERLMDFEEFRLYRENFLGRFISFSKYCDFSRLKPDQENGNVLLKEILKLGFFYYENAYYFYLESKSIESAESALKNFENKVQIYKHVVPQELMDKVEKLKFETSKLIEEKKQKFEKLSQKEKKEYEKNINKEGNRKPHHKEISYFYSFIQTEEFLKKFKKHERELIKDAEKYFQNEFTSLESLEETASKFENKEFMFLVILRRMEHHIYKTQTQNQEGFIRGVKKYHTRIQELIKIQEVKPPDYIEKMANYWLKRAQFEMVSACQNKYLIHVHEKA